MRVLLIHCHPRADSLTAAVRACVIDTLAGHELRVTDLYARGFDPCLSAAEHETYETGQPPADLVQDIDDLMWCDTLIFVYPTWWYGLPAMLKGWLDRVLLPGVAFHLPEPGGTIRPGLTHIRRLGVLTTCGASWWLTRLVGAPGRRTLMRGVGYLCAPRLRRAYAAHYLIDSSTPESRARHLARVRRTVARLMRGAPPPSLQESRP